MSLWGSAQVGTCLSGGEGVPRPQGGPRPVRKVFLSFIKSPVPTDFWFYTEYGGEK